MEVMIAVVETEFTEGWLHIVSYSCVSPKDGSLKRTEHAAKKHHWAQNCTFPVSTISMSRAVQTAQSTLCFSLCPFMSYYSGKWALSSDWREARLQEGSRKPQCHSAAGAEGPDGVGRNTFTGYSLVWSWLWTGGARPRAAIFHPHMPYGSALPD